MKSLACCNVANNLVEVFRLGGLNVVNGNVISVTDTTEKISQAHQNKTLII
jgi:hypothetical protein